MSRTVPMDQFEGLGLLPLIILVKVAGIGGWIEDLLEEMNYTAEEIANNHMKEARELGIAIGKDRDGIADTGSNIVKNRQFVKVDVALAELGLLGYKMTAAGWFWRVDDRGRKRFLQIVLTKTGNAVRLPERVEKLFGATAQFCNIWANVKESEKCNLFRLDTINIPVPRPGMVAEEELHCSFAEGRNTYLVTVPR